MTLFSFLSNLITIHLSALIIVGCLDPPFGFRHFFRKLRRPGRVDLSSWPLSKSEYFNGSPGPLLHSQKVVDSYLVMDSSKCWTYRHQSGITSDPTSVLHQSHGCPLSHFFLWQRPLRRLTSRRMVGDTKAQTNTRTHTKDHTWLFVGLNMYEYIVVEQLSCDFVFLLSLCSRTK